MTNTQGCLIAFEGLDQSGKETQANRLIARFAAGGRVAGVIAFPDRGTAIGQEIERGLRGQRDYRGDVMQLLYVANRYEWKPQIEEWLAAGDVVVCDRYMASSVAYGEAQGLDPAWLTEIQKYLPSAALTVVLDIAPETAVRRKAADRDRYERDLAMLSRVRASYRRQAAGAADWALVDGERPPDVVFADVISAAATRLAPR